MSFISKDAMLEYWGLLATAHLNLATHHYNSTLPLGARGTMVVSAQTGSPWRITQVLFGKTQQSCKSEPGGFLCPARGA